MMKYVFFGTPRFAAIILEGLIRGGIPPAAVVCNPDRPVGRKKIITPPPTKELTIKHGRAITILQPEKLDEHFLQQLKALKPDLFVVAAYAKILPRAVLDLPRLGTLGVHPSLLPNYRGPSPIQSAILNGEKETGVTIYVMDEKMDHGPILAQKQCTTARDESYLDLEEMLATMSGGLLARTMPLFLTGKVKPRIQDESRATYTKKFTAEDGFVDPEDLAGAERGEAEKALLIMRKILALNPEPGAWTHRNGARVKLLAARMENGSLKLSRTQKAGGTPTTGSVL